ncbi:M85 family metallopeptidase, partial [Arsenophonus sp.]|uniref:M85 family metallopeptidase n=1 Tax=Arsenophonus sp. TaxID=1872640 RepID=UPI00387A627B
MIEPKNIVYRASSINPTTILDRGGFYPSREPGEIFSFDLTRHFEGEALEGETSAFISTSYSLQSTILHAASLARPNSELGYCEDFFYYIYMIRPSDNFYDLEASLRYAINQLPESDERRNRYQRVLSDYGGMHELVAPNNIPADRIMRYAILTGSMLNTYGTSDNSLLFTDAFWSERWMSNGILYNEAYNEDHSNPYPYVTTTRQTSRYSDNYAAHVITIGERNRLSEAQLYDIIVGVRQSIRQSYCFLAEPYTAFAIEDTIRTATLLSQTFRDILAFSVSPERRE